ncbi:MAG: ribonuclease Z [Promethearchaeota archaeon]|jgi:ribonuclease Z
MDMKLVFLGTSGSMPTPSRGSPSVVIKRGKDLIMFDCGEGTQRQMVRAKIGFRKNMQILITHLHGDHVLGLPGLLQSMSLLRREKKLDIFGPPGTTSFIKGFCDSLGGPTFPVIIHEIIEPGTIFENPQYRIEAIKAEHTVIAYSYAIIENPRPGRFYPNKAESLEVPKGKLWHKLQHGETIKINNRRVYSSQVTDPPKKGRKIVYSGDTKPNNELIRLSKNADVLIHESTFNQELGERAENDGHSTALQAAMIARESKVEKLVLTHISSRFPNPNILLDESKEIFSNTIIADDLLELDISYRD